ncbi:WD40 repeat domain-containing protein [Candidatus Bipolaricaulota bacterium]|nr:WD40 repeat domain-containing protein [Candidatus Bipolaricaulota bacterium]
MRNKRTLCVALLLLTLLGTDVLGLSCVEADPPGGLPILEMITIDNVDRLLCVRTLSIPEYSRGALSQCSVAFSPDGSLLVVASGRNPMPVWDVQSGLVLRRFFEGSPQQIVACAFSPDGSVLACGGFARAITLWNPSTGAEIASWPAHAAQVWDLAFSPDGATLASCSLSGGVRLWRVPSGEMLWSFAGARGYLSVAFHPMGAALACGGRWDGAGILDAASGTTVAMLPQPSRPVGDVAFSPSGELFAAGTDEDLIYLWSFSDYAPLASLAGHEGYVNGVAFSPDGVLVASGSHDKTVRVWQVDGCMLLKVLEGHSAEVLRVAFSPDGMLIASTSWDGTVRLWGVPREAM